MTHWACGRENANCCFKLEPRGVLQRTQFKGYAAYKSWMHWQARNRGAVESEESVNSFPAVYQFCECTRMCGILQFKPSQNGDSKEVMWRGEAGLTLTQNCCRAQNDWHLVWYTRHVPLLWVDQFPDVPSSIWESWMFVLKKSHDLINDLFFFLSFSPIFFFHRGQITAKLPLILIRLARNSNHKSRRYRPGNEQWIQSPRISH